MVSSLFIFSFKMKKFIIDVSLFSLILLLVLIVGAVLPTTPRASESLLFAKTEKDNLLKNVSSPRIILVGGSNLSFGINSNILKDSLKISPINTAIHAGLGLEFMMDNTIQYIQKGDIVILAPEYNHFYGRLIHGQEELLRTIADMEPLRIMSLKKEQLRNIVKFIPKYSFSKFKPTEYYGYIVNHIYSVNSFNQYGDVYTHWELGQQEFNPDGVIGESYNPKAIKLITQFQLELENKGAKLLVTYPSYQASSYDMNVDKIKKIEQEFFKNGFVVLGTPERYRMSNNLMFNTSYHLLKKGADYRTHLLVQDIKEKLVNNKL